MADEEGRQARSGPVGEATAHLFGARELLEHAVGWIERNFPSGGATDLP